MMTEIPIGMGKQPLILKSPVMPAAGVFGFGGEYGQLVAIDRLGAVITNPITLAPRKPARGPHVVPLIGGALLHTGLPNPGVSAVIRQYEARWRALSVPLIVHVAATTPDSMRRCAELLDRIEVVAALEIGVHDQITAGDLTEMLKAAHEGTLKPLLVRLPLHSAAALAEVITGPEPTPDNWLDAGGLADALVIAAPPRGTARDPGTGQLVGGRLYGPWIKPMCLLAVGQIAAAVDLPVIGCGGVHSAQDVRDYLEAGAVAVQVDSAVWVDPGVLDAITGEI